MSNLSNEMSIVSSSQCKPDGNTRTSGQYYRWSFTLPFEEVTSRQLSQLLKSFCKKFTFQAERSESGYEHWQGEFSCITKEYFNPLKNFLGFNKIHLEPTKNLFAAQRYCSKTETRFEGPYTEKSSFIKIIENLYPWQASLEQELLVEPDDRKIIWYADMTGGLGKTQFAKYMSVKHKATVLCNAKTSDIAHAIEDNPKIIIFLLPRSSESYFNYGALEMVKDGMIFSAKYDSHMKVFEAPHVVVFSNFEPHVHELTQDRWDIRRT